MAKFITTDFGKIHDALNILILNEVKEALGLLPEEWMEGPSLCRIVVSKADDYSPKDVAVDNIWVNNDKIYFDGHIMPLPDDANVEPEQYEGDEDDTDWIDITDFQYLISQIKNKLPKKVTYTISNKADKAILRKSISESVIRY
jgi:hypothetical protein